MPFQLFGSYTRADSDDVLPVIRGLKDRRVEVFLDVEDMKPGDDWRIRGSPNSDGRMTWSSTTVTNATRPRNRPETLCA